MVDAPDRDALLVELEHVAHSRGMGLKQACRETGRRPRIRWPRFTRPVGLGATGDFPDRDALLVELEHAADPVGVGPEGMMPWEPVGEGGQDETLSRVKNVTFRTERNRTAICSSLTLLSQKR